ncbi:hypothetical protein MNVI_45440 [Mycobacterium noviomagense]|uniref:Uncharacterized protein n=1 Tax=Mycobacterium noviomagense TaxID=459858 RepID=A0A7I7PKY3_9MYCO|nr:hypothetical protein MNVI_45440 [Mycobacterium noviomagense]
MSNGAGGGGPANSIHHTGSKVAVKIAPAISPATPVPTATPTGWRRTIDGVGAGGKVTV